MKKSLLYTRGGDTGVTSLFGGKRVKKFDQRIKTIGAVDELNAVLGLTASKTEKETKSLIERIQNELFTFGAVLANPDKQKDKNDQVLTLSGETVVFLEKKIDEIDSSLPPLENFILPGGSEPASLFHLSRAICRRAERKLTRLSETAEIDPILNKYLNRLSDLLFALARNENKKNNLPDKIWQKP